VESIDDAEERRIGDDVYVILGQCKHKSVKGYSPSASMTYRMVVLRGLVPLE
jgi:hypothetical protein